jgi:hypothetical protein
MTSDHGVGGVVELENLFDQGGTFVQEGFGVHVRIVPPAPVRGFPPRGTMPVARQSRFHGISGLGTSRAGHLFGVSVSRGTG